MVQQTVKIENFAGIHVRPSGVIIQAAQGYEGRITVSGNGMDTDLTNIMGLIAMGLAQSDEVSISVEGPAEVEKLSTLVELFSRKFDFPPAAAAEPVIKTNLQEGNMSGTLHALINQGADLLSLGNFEEAERCFSQVLEEDSDHLLALFNSAIALSKLDKFKIAEERMLKYLGARKDDAEAWNQLGFIRFQSGNYGEAAKAYSRAEELEPANATIQNNIGALNFIQGRHEQALERFVRALEINPAHKDALFNIIDTCEILGRPEEARKYRRNRT